MLTHQNKKPFECKSEGCGKSYCDARSLRRHIENHHETPKVKSTAIRDNNDKVEEVTNCDGQYKSHPLLGSLLSQPNIGSALIKRESINSIEKPRNANMENTHSYALNNVILSSS